MSGRARHRDAILDLLSSTGRFHSASQVLADLRGRGRPVGVTTVYRTLRKLTAAHEVDVVTLDDGVRYFRRCGQVEHYHLVCRGCGSTVEISGAGVRAWAATLARRHGYRDIELQLQLSGWCAGCSRYPVASAADVPGRAGPVEQRRPTA
jgi:Fur family ferric uptake transcriptional regulator